MKKSPFRTSRVFQVKSLEMQMREMSSLLAESNARAAAAASVSAHANDTGAADRKSGKQ